MSVLLLNVSTTITQKKISLPFASWNPLFHHFSLSNIISALIMCGIWWLPYNGNWNDEIMNGLVYLPQSSHEQLWNILNNTKSIILGAVPLLVLLPPVTPTCLDIALPDATLNEWITFLQEIDYSQNSHNPYCSVDGLSYGLSEVMGSRR